MSQRIRFCPKCGSAEVKPLNTEMDSPLGAVHEGETQKWECSSCGYTGLMPERDKEQ